MRRSEEILLRREAQPTTERKGKKLTTRIRVIGSAEKRWIEERSPITFAIFQNIDPHILLFLLKQGDKTA